MAKLKKTIKIKTFMEPRKMRKATTGLDKGGFFVEEKSPSYSTKKEYTIGHTHHGQRPDSVMTTQHVISKELHDAFVKEAERQWKQFKDIIENGEEMTTKEEY